MGKMHKILGNDAWPSWIAGHEDRARIDTNAGSAMSVVKDDFRSFLESRDLINFNCNFLEKIGGS